MPKSYEIEVPSIAETAVTGVALVVNDTIRGHAWRMLCDSAGRPLALRRDGKPVASVPTALQPMLRFAARFLAPVKESCNLNVQFVYFVHYL